MTWSLMVLGILAVLGVLIGPSLHHLGIRAGARRPFDGVAPRCETCDRVRPPLAMRCRERHTVRTREPWIWVASGSLWVSAGVVTDEARWLLPAYLMLACVTIVLLITDLDHKLIPNRILYPATAITFGLLVVGAIAERSTDRLLPAAAGGAGYFAVLLGVYLIARGGFGFGDVKLAVLLGAVTAFQSQRVILLAVFFTGVIGAIPALVMLVWRKARFTDEIPYGPPMLAGAWVALVYGEAFGRIISG